MPIPLPIEVFLLSDVVLVAYQRAVEKFIRTPEVAQRVSPDKMSDDHLLVRDDGMADIGVFVAGKWTPILRGVPANHFQLADPVGEA